MEEKLVVTVFVSKFQVREKLQFQLIFRNLKTIVFVGGVYLSGILSMLSCGSLAIFSILSVIQLAMITSGEEVVLNYKTCVILKLALAIFAGIFILLSKILSIKFDKLLITIGSYELASLLQ